MRLAVCPKTFLEKYSLKNFRPPFLKGGGVLGAEPRYLPLTSETPCRGRLIFCAYRKKSFGERGASSVFFAFSVLSLPRGGWLGTIGSLLIKPDIPDVFVVGLKTHQNLFQRVLFRSQRLGNFLRAEICKSGGFRIFIE